jgi:hypothetical protein
MSAAIDAMETERDGKPPKQSNQAGKGCQDFPIPFNPKPTIRATPVPCGSSIHRETQQPLAVTLLLKRRESKTRTCEMSVFFGTESSANETIPVQTSIAHSQTTREQRNS